MPVPLRDSAGALVVVNERSTLPVSLTFRDGDEADAPLITSVVSSVWSLVDPSGSAVNGQEDEVLTISAGVALIVLTDADLATTATAKAARHLTIDVVYNSLTYGNNRRLTEEFVFWIAPLAGIPAGG